MRERESERARETNRQTDMDRESKPERGGGHIELHIRCSIALKSSESREKWGMKITRLA